MRKQYKIQLLKRAVKDLDSICEYLSLFTINAAKNFLDRLEKVLDQLAAHPQMYPECELGRHYRKLVLGNHLVFYKVLSTDKTIKIYRILHAKRDTSIYWRSPQA
ncbi:MAG: type II toxin-antitoxin system RelE/ParE family toxin [Candidatus Margulisbacteria bacterium]|jgi:plasmid stabilization system protein ParE|nr:type II toxin-antitoxin system RelE/ParE family toxin [Candidatus Margulisiibacteriota bacterium]